MYPFSPIWLGLPKNSFLIFARLRAFEEAAVQAKNPKYKGKYILFAQQSALTDGQMAPNTLRKILRALEEAGLIAAVPFELLRTKYSAFVASNGHWANPHKIPNYYVIFPEKEADQAWRGAQVTEKTS